MKTETETVRDFNAHKLNIIAEAGSTYRVRKYAGAWVPVAVVSGKVFTGPHCSTSGGAMTSAIDLCAARSVARLGRVGQ
tara:strand:- start:1269 stop:1505 length:237 start_codon:yes stop_codon:yes gene_type:complete